jgi:hypothetical protein
MRSISRRPGLSRTALLVGIALALSVFGSAQAVAGSGSAEVRSLRGVAARWIGFAWRGNAPKACLLQTEESVNGLRCDQLHGYGKVFYCPSFEPPKSQQPRTIGEQIVKVTVEGGRGRVIVRSANKKSAFRATLIFRRLDGRWRIGYFQWPGHRLNPAGLIFEDGKEAREELWPLSC